MRLIRTAILNCVDWDVKSQHSPTLNTALYKEACQHCADNVSLLANFQNGADDVTRHSVI